MIKTFLATSLLVASALLSSQAHATVILTPVLLCIGELGNFGGKGQPTCFEACVNPDLTTNCGLGKNPEETAKICAALCQGVTKKTKTETSTSNASPGKSEF